MRTEKRERSGAGNGRDYPYSTGEGGRRQERRNTDEDLKCELKLSPMGVVTETLMKEKENNQCGLEEVEPNGNWKVMIIVIVVINIIGFAAMTFAMF